jgi:hypothetical protein
MKKKAFTTPTSKIGVRAMTNFEQCCPVLLVFDCLNALFLQPLEMIFHCFQLFG